MSTKQDILEKLIETALDPTEFEVVTVVFQKSGKDWFLRVFIDHPDGVTLEHCQNATHLIFEALDREDPIAQAYQLEVSSPGVDRPLVKPADYRRFVGERVFVKTHQAIEGTKKFNGELMAFRESEEAVEVLQEHDSKIYIIPLDAIAKATLKPILNFG